MKSKRIRRIIMVSLTVVLAAAGAYAAAANQLSYVEKFETDKVDIDLEELFVNEEGETAESDEIVEANKDVSYIPRITNRSADCYVRARVDVVMEGECEDPLGIDNVFGLSGDWVMRGDYFYYTKSLAKGESADLFKGIHIPEDWEYGNAEGFSVSVRAEAVQSANFEPDFRNDLPWGAVSLQQIASGEGLECMEAVPVSLISDVEVTSDGGFQCTSAELFDDFSGMMPGDNYEKTINISNSAADPVRVSLKVNSGDSDLNDRINVAITAEDREIYSGTAADVNGLETMELMQIAKGSSGKVQLQMQLPAETDNDYTEMEDDIVWDLAIEEISDDSVQTGDASDLMLFIIIAITAMMVMLALVLYDRRNRYEANR